MGSSPVSRDFLYLPLSISNLESSSLACDLTSLLALGRAVDFQFVNLLLVRMGRHLPSCLQVGLETISSSANLKSRFHACPTW